MSALDPEVGHKLFDDCIQGVLKEKTVILVTHSMDILKDVDRVFVLDVKSVASDGSGGGGASAVTSEMKDEETSNLVGYIREKGTYQELLSAGLDFAIMLGKEGGDDDDDDDNNNNNNNNNNNGGRTQQQVETTMDTAGRTISSSDVGLKQPKTMRSASVDSASSIASLNKNKVGKVVGKIAAKELMQKEEREKGSVSTKVYWAYVQAGGGVCRFLFLMFWYVSHCGLTILNTAWVAVWTADSQYKKQTMFFYLGK